MKIDFNQKLKTFDDEILQDQDGKELTLRWACVNSLLATEANLEGTEKLERYDLGLKIHRSNGQLEVSTENIVKLKKLVSSTQVTLIVGQVLPMLENQSEHKVE